MILPHEHAFKKCSSNVTTFQTCIYYNFEMSKLRNVVVIVVPLQTRFVKTYSRSYSSNVAMEEHQHAGCLQFSVLFFCNLLLHENDCQSINIASLFATSNVSLSQ